MGKARLQFQVPIDIECPYMLSSRPQVHCQIKGNVRLEHCVNLCDCPARRINVKDKESKIERGDINVQAGLVCN